MLPSGLKTSREVALCYDSIYDTLIESGKAFPFLYPWAGLGAFVVLGYILIDHRNSPTLKWLRYPVFAWLVSFQAWVIATNKARHPAGAFGVGLLSAWGVLWVSTIMVVNDCQTDFKRIERKPAAESKSKAESTLNGSTSNGTISKSSTQQSQKGHRNSLDELPDGYTWQPCPTSLVERLDWTADAFCNFRGIGWNWQTSTVPAPPKDLQGNSTSSFGIRRFTSKPALVRQTLKDLAIGYLILDLIKLLITQDAYFWGYMDAPAPSYLPLSIADSRVLLRSYRLLISLGGMYFALWQIFKLGPLFFCGVLGPKWIGTRGEAWMNPPDMFGAFRCILEHGLAGWWSGWWHQTFRVAFNAHARWVVEVLGVDGRSEKGKVVALVVAFFLSGCLHACASFTQLGETRPLLGPMRFFLLQPCGILSQMWSVRQLDQMGVRHRTPRVLRLLVNCIYTHVWLYYTAPILVDDFAKGGVWLYEPVPISILRGLGLGAKDESWLCWDNAILFWHSGKHWWDTGIGV